MKIKVNVWQVGFDNIEAYMLGEGEKAICKERGYVVIDDLKNWEETVWDLLNWSCWTNKKPDNVFSSLDHCNSDIVIQIEGSHEYKRAESMGWSHYATLEAAIEALKKTPYSLWPLAETPRSYTAYKTDGETVWGSNNNKDWYII